MNDETPGRGVSGLETPLEGHPGPAELDLDAICEKWLQRCPSCDAGLPAACTHPDEDYRPVMLDLVCEVERLHTWAGLMSVVNEQYPTDVFPVIEDRPEADPGVRILSLVRHLDRARVVVETAVAIVTFLRERGWTPENEWFIPQTVPFVAAVEAWQRGGDAP